MTKSFSDKDLLLIFIKNPVLGKVKTRLAKTVGKEKALKIYNLLLDHTLKLTHSLPLTKYLFYDTHIQRNDMWSDLHYQKFLQEGEDLGQRMYKAFLKGFNDAYSSIVIIGSDCRELHYDILANAFEALKTSDVVIGPAKDGGYYLLGMKQLIPSLFKNKSWSSPQVFNETMTDINLLNLRCHLLPVLSDIDTEDDLINHSKYFKE
ncbi:MAG TPA: TIGR04282 family arsenosugar biosynthesis glycosyltransferase [Cytophagales bacterium]|nr:TIGR04282 family arsenosugar biosynthesis glycosyltransferase [Cytophagales bacterium]